MIRTCKRMLLGIGFAAIVVSVVAFMPRADGSGTVMLGLFDAQQHYPTGLPSILPPSGMTSSP